MMLNKSRILLLLPLLILNCGLYSIKGSIPSHLDSLVLMSPINETSEFNLGEILSDKLLNSLLTEGILKIMPFENADSKLDIIIKNLSDDPDVISQNSIGYESVKQWKIIIEIEILWYDLVKNEDIINKTIYESVVYVLNENIGEDNIDNDLDGYIDSQDIDETGIGTPRDGAIRICMNKISKRIVNELTSTW